jgi:hypothetical protein
MAERAEQAHHEQDEVPPEKSVALASLVLTERRARQPSREQWTARAADGRVVDVWCLAPMDAAFRRRWSDAASGLARVRHPNVVPVLAAGERDGGIWVVSELDAGCPLRRLLAVATLTPEQAALIVAGVLAGLRALHQAGLWHGWLDDRTVHVGVAGQVRLGQWSLRLDDPGPETPRRGDRQAAVSLFGRLGRSVRRTGRRQVDTAALLATLDTCHGEDREDVALLEQAGEAAAAIVHGRAGERAAAELAALVGSLGRNRPATSRSPVAAPPPRQSLRWPRATWTPAPHRARRVAAGLAALVIIGVIGALALIAPQGRPRLLAVLPQSGRATSAPAVTRLRAPSPSPTPTGPRPVPVLAPPAAGPITAIEIQTLGGSCHPAATCPVQVTVRLLPQPAAQEVRWSFHVFDRCTGTTVILPGASVTALAGWAYVYGTSRPALSAAHTLALVVVTESPAAAASPAVLAGGTSPC